MIRTISGLLISFLITTSATAQTATADAAESSTPQMGEPSSRQNTYEGLLAIGHAKYVASDYAGAVTEYEKARQKSPAKPDAYYFIGCALRAQSNYRRAISMLASAATVAGEDAPAMNARALFAVATTWEAAQNLDKAKYAWIQYKAFAKLHPEQNPFIEVADSHIAAIDARQQQVSEYARVNERIAADAADNE